MFYSELDGLLSNTADWNNCMEPLFCKFGPFAKLASMVDEVVDIGTKHLQPTQWFVTWWNASIGQFKFDFHICPPSFWPFSGSL